MFEIWAYKRYKKRKEKKAQETQGEQRKIVEAPSPPATATTTTIPVLDDEDQRFFSSLLSRFSDSSTPDARPSTPEIALDSDSGDDEPHHAAPSPPLTTVATTTTEKPQETSTRDRISGLFRRNTAAAVLATRTEPGVPATLVSPAEAEHERRDIWRLLQKLNLSTTSNDRVVAISRDSADLVGKFTLVLRDLVNGVPTAANDLKGLLDDRDGNLARGYDKLPKSMKKLVNVLPDKVTAALGPDVLAAAAAAQGIQGDFRNGNTKDAAKKLFGPSNLLELVTKPGAVVTMLKSIVNALKLRWPAFIGTNVLWSVAIFLLLFVLWYCYKRGREERLERERQKSGLSPVDGTDRIEELPDDPALPAPPPPSTSPRSHTKRRMTSSSVQKAGRSEREREREQEHGRERGREHRDSDRHEKSKDKERRRRSK